MNLYTLIKLFFRPRKRAFKYQKRFPKSLNLLEQGEYQRYSDQKRALSTTEIKDVFDDLPIANVKQVIDGDTVIVWKQDQLIKIRLDAIDCPENGQEWGDNAKYGLIKLIGGSLIKLEEHGIDNHGRLLATIYVENDNKSEWINVNEKMVMRGHAWVMRLFYKHLPKERQNQLNRLENWAKTKKVGLWRNPNPIPPWSWRKSS